MQRHNWKLFFHPCIVEQLKKLKAATNHASAADPVGFAANANVKLYRALIHLILEIVPLDPGLDEYRQGNTIGRDYRHWRRAKIWRRFRLFFRYDSRTRVIVYAWSMMNRPCAPPTASPIPTLYFGKCWNEGSRLMTGQPYSRQTSQIGHERRGLASHQSANICLSMSHGQVFGNADRPLP